MFTSESIRVDNRGATAKEEVKKSLLASPTPSTIESFVRCNDRKTHTHVRVDARTTSQRDQSYSGG